MEKVYKDILELLKSLPLEKVIEVRDFAEFLNQKTKKKRDFSKIFGTISEEDAEEMLKAIEDACEKINSEW